MSELGKMALVDLYLHGLFNRCAVEPVAKVLIQRDEPFSCPIRLVSNTVKVVILKVGKY